MLQHAVLCVYHLRPKHHAAVKARVASTGRTLCLRVLHTVSLTVRSAAVMEHLQSISLLLCTKISMCGGEMCGEVLPGWTQQLTDRTRKQAAVRDDLFHQAGHTARHHASAPKQCCCAEGTGPR